MILKTTINRLVNFFNTKSKTYNNKTYNNETYFHYIYSNFFFYKFFKKKYENHNHKDKKKNSKPTDWLDNLFFEKISSDFFYEEIRYDFFRRYEYVYLQHKFDFFIRTPDEIYFSYGNSFSEKKVLNFYSFDFFITFFKVFINNQKNYLYTFFYFYINFFFIPFRFFFYSIYINFFFKIFISLYNDSIKIYSRTFMNSINNELNFEFPENESFLVIIYDFLNEIFEKPIEAFSLFHDVKLIKDTFFFKEFDLFTQLFIRTNLSFFYQFNYSFSEDYFFILKEFYSVIHNRTLSYNLKKIDNFFWLDEDKYFLEIPEPEYKYDYQFQHDEYILDEFFKRLKIFYNNEKLFNFNFFFKLDSFSLLFKINYLNFFNLFKNINLFSFKYFINFYKFFYNSIFSKKYFYEFFTIFVKFKNINYIDKINFFLKKIKKINYIFFFGEKKKIKNRINFFKKNFLVLEIRQTMYKFFFFNKNFTSSKLNFFVLNYSFFKNFLISFFLCIFYFYFCFVIFNLNFFKNFSYWILILIFIYYIFSTFNFFIKRYKFAKFTSALQRFWKRAYTCFWLIEGFLFLIFTYYLLNASSEPVFIYDNYSNYLNDCFSLKSFIFNFFFLIFILNIFSYLILNIKHKSFFKISFDFNLILLIFFFILLVESYQFYYLVNSYDEHFWFFDYEDCIWEIDFDLPRMRNKNHYNSLILLAKFWHFIFIFVSWVFFLIKAFEQKKYKFFILASNYQNILILLILNCFCAISYIKWIFRRFLDQTYYWFFTSFRVNNFNSIFLDIFNIIKSFYNYTYSFKKQLNFHFFYFVNDDNLLYKGLFFNKF